ncbi:MAG: cupin [Rhodospirillaceae bacterium]|nr:cupin [Rhodospirillaceae bacterium]
MPDGDRNVNGQLNVDFSARAEMFTTDMPWVDEQGRDRKVVYRDLTGSHPRMTAVVRYSAGTDLPRHGHPAGEEVYVIDGVLEDEDGVYPAGTYLLLPAGTGHGPKSKEGCTFFVRQGQYPGAGRPRIELKTDALEWEPGRYPGITQAVLFRDDERGELIRLIRIEAGCEIPQHAHERVEEIFLISGDVVDPNGTFGPGCWTRDPIGSGHWARSETGALLYVHTGPAPD